MDDNETTIVIGALTTLLDGAKQVTITVTYDWPEEETDD